MFNKSNLFHKTADTPVTRTTPRPTGNSGTTSSVLAAAEPALTGPAAARTLLVVPELPVGRGVLRVSGVAAVVLHRMDCLNMLSL